MDQRYDDLVRAMQLYFDGLHFSDSARLAAVFHAEARYASVADGRLVHLGMADYFAIVDRRPSPASRGEPRRDRIVAISFAGPTTALVRAECAIGPKSFTDLLNFVHIDGRWQIIAKVFHFDLAPAA